MGYILHCMKSEGRTVSRTLKLCIISNPCLFFVSNYAHWTEMMLIESTKAM